MVFGWSKSKQSQSGDLDLAYGNNDVADDESSVGASVPPPPPDGKDMYNSYTDQTFRDEAGEDQYMSTGGYYAEEREAQDVGVSMLSESEDYGSGKDPARRKKALVIMTCILTFCVLVGVAVAYGRNGSNNSQSSNYSSLDGGTTDSTVPPGNSGLFNGTSGADSNTTIVGDLDEPEPEPVDTPLDETTPEPTDSPVDETTPDPTESLAPEATDSPETPEPSETEAPELSNTTATDEFPACIFNEVSATAMCEDGVSIVTIFLCKPGEVDDEFWAWESAPEEYQSFVDRDWNWLQDSGTGEIIRTNLPDGPYTFGIYGRGDEELDEYPLIASTDFTVACRER